MDDPTAAPANPYEAAHRARRASLLAAAAARVPMSAAQAEVATVGQRHMLAMLAGISDPSDATWAMVVALLRGGEAVAASDPFKGAA